MPRLPSPVRLFAVLAAVWAVWFALYEGVLLPHGGLDRAISLHVAAVTAGLLGPLGAEVSGRVVALPGAVGVYVADGCNGLAALGLFVGFVVAFPGRWRRRAWFLPAGLGAVYAVNVLRIAVLLLVQRHAPALFDPLHYFGTSLVFYAAIFGLWVLWTRVGGADAAAESTRPALARA